LQSSIPALSFDSPFLLSFFYFGPSLSPILALFPWRAYSLA
jgi:hypothetical protein